MEALTGVLTHNVVSLRAEPDARSEQVSQALLGCGVLMLESRAGFTRVRTPDCYEGWVRREHLRACAPGDIYGAPDWHTRTPHTVVVTAAFAPVSTCRGGKELLTTLAYGTTVRAVRRIRAGGQQRVSLPIGTQPGDGELEGFISSRHIAPVHPAGKFHGRRIARRAAEFVGTPYLWGGGSPWGFDCSGFVQALYRSAGVLLPRDAHMQAASSLGAKLPEGSPARAGDLLFFCGSEDRHGRGITHVGMALGRDTLVHAFGRDGVVVDALQDLLTVHGYTLWGAWRPGRKRS